MSIRSPLEDGLYVQPVRPNRLWIRYFVRYYPYLIGMLLSLIVLGTLFVVDPILTVLLIVGYWIYLFTRTQSRKYREWASFYSLPIVQLIRVFALVAGVTFLLFYVYEQTDYLNKVQDDMLWLLYLPTMSIVSQRGPRGMFFVILSAVIISLFLVHPADGVVLLSTPRPITLEFLVKGIWLTFISLTSHILLRYMSDALADLNLIIHVQNRIRQMEGALLRSIAYLNESKYLERAVEIIGGDLYYDHVNIFRLDKYNKELICTAGASNEGKKLALDGYSVNIIDQESIIGHVAKSGKSYLSNNVANDSFYLPHKVFSDTQAELAVPIRVRNRLYGVLDIQVNQPYYFLDQDLKAIEILTNHIGWVIDNSAQFDHISWVNRIIETIAAPIFTQSHLDETLQEIADSALEELDADLVFLYSYDSSVDEGLSGPIYSGNLLRPELLDSTPVDKDNVVFRLISDIGQIHVNEDLDNIELDEHPLFRPSQAHILSGRPTFVKREKVKANVIIRLLNNEQCVGLLFLNFRTARSFSAWEQKRYLSFAHLAALAIQKMQLQQHVIQKEMNDLSNWIHDILIGDTLGLFKILKSINLSSEKAPSDKLRKKIDLAIETTEHLHNDIRWINRLLKETSADDLMLELDRLFMLFKQVFKVNAATEWTGDTRLISPVLSRELFIVIREALTNAVRHGKAKNIMISGSIRSNNLDATITDDGVGFNPKLVKRMNGLLSMKYRIEEMGGLFKLNSNPGKGTKIVITVPFQNSNEGAL
jgi:signal transduction histidine kinase